MLPTGSIVLGIQIDSKRCVRVSCQNELHDLHAELPGIPFEFDIELVTPIEVGIERQEVKPVRGFMLFLETQLHQKMPELTVNLVGELINAETTVNFGVTPPAAIIIIRQVEFRIQDLCDPVADEPQIGVITENLLNRRNRDLLLDDHGQVLSD